MHRFWKVFGTLCLVGVLTGAMFTGLFLYYIKTNIMDSSISDITLSEVPVNLSSTIWYKDQETGQYMQWVQLATTENRIWVEYEDIPKDFEHAFVAIEDERFYQHHGVDWKRTIAAALNMFTDGKTFGGSTITQQLIKNITGDNEVTVKRKLLEICRALKLEKKYDKEDIIEWYMNIIFFGHSQYGIGAAAKYYFDKDVSSLTLAEMCSIAGITNNPSKYSPYIYPDNNKSRQELILDKMLELGYIDEATCEAAKSEPLHFAEHTESENNGTEAYPYYVDAVIEDAISWFEQEYNVSEKQATSMLYYGGYDIYTCVDMHVQEKMDQIYQNLDQIPKTRDGKQLQSSMVVIDPYTGDIVGLEGGVGKKTVARGLNWATSSLGRRPPGSSIKPIAVYAPAFEQGVITPSTMFLDAEGIHLKGTGWMPNNDDRRHHGYVSVRYGVVHSLNTIAAQVMDRLTPAASYDFLTQKLHMELEPDDRNYAPLSMGQLSIGTTAREMASAYTIFPTGGTYVQGRTFSEIRDHNGNVICENKPVTEQAINGKTANWMTDILQEAVRSGTGTGARLNNMPSAGKTGTTSDNKDRWFVGYTPYYVGAVWTGYETPAKISVSGNPAAALWKKVMTSLHEDLPYKDFAKADESNVKPIQEDQPVVLPYYVQGIATDQNGSEIVLYQEQVGSGTAGEWASAAPKQVPGYQATSSSSVSIQLSEYKENVVSFYYTQEPEVSMPVTPEEPKLPVYPDEIEPVPDDGMGTGLITEPWQENNPGAYQDDWQNQPVDWGWQNGNITLPEFSG